METTYYTFAARKILVEGETVEQISGSNARQLVCVRKAARSENRAEENKVVDFAAWKADREEKDRLEQLWYADVKEPESAEANEFAEEYVPRTRKTHRSLLNWELWSSAAVIGTMALLAVRILSVF